MDHGGKGDASADTMPGKDLHGKADLKILLTSLFCVFLHSCIPGALLPSKAGLDGGVPLQLVAVVDDATTKESNLQQKLHSRVALSLQLFAFLHFRSLVFSLLEDGIIRDRGEPPLLSGTAADASPVTDVQQKVDLEGEAEVLCLKTKVEALLPSAAASGKTGRGFKFSGPVAAACVGTIAAWARGWIPFSQLSAHRDNDIVALHGSEDDPDKIPLPSEGVIKVMAFLYGLGEVQRPLGSICRQLLTISRLFEQACVEIANSLIHVKKMWRDCQNEVNRMEGGT